MWSRLAIFGFLALNILGQDQTYLAKWTQEGDTMTLRVRGPVVRWAVSGAPYSGVMSGGRESTLPDGTHIFKAAPITQKMWRDSQGRMRTEQVLAGDGGEFMMADINDPVVGLAYVMDDNNHVIHRFTLVPLAEWKRPPQKKPRSAGKGASSTSAKGILKESLSRVEG
jgi:hypothetical protein